MNPRYTVVARRAGHRCEYCRAPESVFNAAFEVEHVIPSVHGGTDDTANLALSCRSCNAHKGGAVVGWDEPSGGWVPLFDPRQQRWEEHFVIDPDSFRIDGRTPTGRVTAERLDFNSPRQLVARDIWARSRLFP